MRRVILESPYAGAIRRNTAYARLCLKDCLARGEAPIASHLLFPQVLDENFPPERKLGCEAGLAWMKNADAVVLYEDFGRSRGMVNALCEAQRLRIPIEHRFLIFNTAAPFMSDTDKEIELGIHWSSPIRRWWRSIWGEPGTFNLSGIKAPVRQEAKSSAEISARPDHSDSNDGAFINQTLARNAPSPVPWGEAKPKRCTKFHDGYQWRYKRD